MKKQRLILYWILAGLIGISYFCLCSQLFGQGQAGRKPLLGEQIDWSHPLSKGLVGFWLMNEGSGNKVFDLSGNGITGTFAAGAASPIWVPGKFGSALSFDGGDYITIDKAPFGAYSPGKTYSVWVKPNFNDDDATANGYVVLDISQDGNTNRVALFWRGGSEDNWRWQFWDENDNQNGATYNIPYFAFSAGDLLHIVGTVNATHQRFYVNGQKLQDVAHGLGTIDLSGQTGKIGITDGLDAGWYWNGTIEQITIYGWDVSDSEAALLYREPFCMLAKDDIAILKAAIPAAAPSGQVITIQMTAIPLVLIIGFCLMMRRRSGKES